MLFPLFIIVTFLLVAIVSVGKLFLHISINTKNLRFSIGSRSLNIFLNSRNLQKAYIQLVLLFPLFVYRNLNTLPIWVYYAYVVANGSVILQFSVIRFYILSASDIHLTCSIYIEFFIVFLLAIIFGIVRFALDLGLKIDKHPDVVSILLKDYSDESQ